MRRRYSVVLAYALIIFGLIFGIKIGSRAVNVISQQLPIRREKRIVIDAGHGGEDGGATSCTGVLESTLNLEVSLRLRDLFHFMGYETVMVRTSDESVYTQGNTIAARKMSDLKERVRLANETENGILISIHQNTFSDSRYSGTQVFYAGRKESLDLAEQLQETFKAALKPDSNRKSKKADGIYLMEHLNGTGVLIECGFLSNPEEEALLRSAKHQQKIACIIASTVSRFQVLDVQTND